MRGQILKVFNGVEFYKTVDILFKPKNRRVVVLDPETDHLLIDCSLDFYEAEKERAELLRQKRVNFNYRVA